MKHELIIREKDFRAIQSHLTQEKVLETGLILLAKISSNKSTIRLISYSIIVPNDEDYLSRSATLIEYHPDFMQKILELSVQNNCHPVALHSHPFSIQNTTFSRHDNFADQQIMGPYITNYFKNLYFASVVVGSNIESLDARIWSRRLHKTIPIQRIKVIGTDKMSIIPTTSALANKQLNYDPAIHNRTVLALGAAAQKKYAGLTVGIIGAGGLGSVVGELLARLPVKTLYIVDNDHLEKSNLNRLTNTYPRDAQYNRLKVDVLSNAYRRINPRINVIPINGDFLTYEVQNRFKSCDFLFDCSDSNLVNLSANRFALANCIPLVDSGCGAFVEKGEMKNAGGQVIKIVPGGNFCYHCADYFSKEFLHEELLDDKEHEASRQLGYISGDVSESDITAQPSVYALNMQTASQAVWLMMQYVSGNSSKIDGIGIDALNYSTQPWIHPDGTNSECIVCGPEGFACSGNEVPLLVKQPKDSTPTLKCNCDDPKPPNSKENSIPQTENKIDCIA